MNADIDRRVNRNSWLLQVDIWAVGAVMHWMLTSVLPWDALTSSQVTNSDGRAYA